MQNIALLGATGSVGKSVLDVIRNYKEDFNLIGVSSYRNQARLEKIISEFQPRYVCLKKEDYDFMKKFPGIEFFHGESGLSELASLPGADTIIIAVSGIAGLYPTISAIKSKKRILSANKESIVAAGEIINRLLSENQASIIPIDSEHNAIFNIFSRMQKNFVKNIILTASGGPFLNREITKDVKVEDVLDHPTWEMGSCITVNSATMMNKGFEVIEAHHLFHLDYKQIKVLIHPQSLAHGIVETIDGTYFIAASPSDMRYPIALSLFYPEIPSQKFPPLDLTNKPFEFFEPDYKKFPLLKLAYEAGREGGLLPAVLNAANEVVVDAFLDNRADFYSLASIIQKIVEMFINRPALTLTIEEILEADRLARSNALSLLAR